MVQFLLDVLIRASDLTLVAVGLSLVYSLIRFPNVALVQYAVIGPFLALFMQRLGFPLPLACVLACALVGGIAVLFDRLIFTRLLRMSSAVAMIGSLALSMILSALFLVAFGPQTQRFDLEVHPAMRVLEARITWHQILSIGLTAAAVAVLALILFRTPLGRAMRATATNATLARATGIDTGAVVATMVGISGVLASLGGTVLAVKGELSIQVGMELLLPVFAAAILGGLGNALGAVAGAITIAAAETVVTNLDIGFLLGGGMLFLPAGYATAASFLILVLALLLRPHGLFTSEVKRV